MIPWITLTVGVWMVAGPFKLWRKPPIQDRSVKFIRAAHAWLAISLVMLLLLPVHQQLSRIPFSHAYYGAIRHAITVGFASLMIMGMAAKVVPTLNGRDPRQLTALWWPFALVNMGCFLRVSLQALTDFYPRFFAVIGISGVLEVIGLGIWAVGLTRIMLKRSEERIEVQPHARSIIRGQDHVGEVVDSHPGALATFVDFGFTQLKNPMLRRTIARAVTIQQAAAMHGVKLDELLAALNQSKVDEHAAIG
jgi:hypothetical protein